MKSLYLIRGLPGSGKTTLANSLSEGVYPVLSADMYFEDSDGNYNWDATKVKCAHAWCKEQCENLMNWRISRIEYPDPFKHHKYYAGDDLNKIFVANTFTQEWEMEDYIKLAEQYGYRVFTIVVENRHKSSNIHGVSEEVLTKMKK